MTQSIFERQMMQLAREFNVVSLGDLCDSIANGRSLDARTIAITIDDGYEDFYTEAYPILKKYSLPATLYVTTDFIDKSAWLWPDIIDYILKSTAFTEYSLGSEGAKGVYRLLEDKDKMNTWSHIADYCLTLNSKEKEVFLRQMALDLRVSVPAVPTSDYQALSWRQIQEMEQNGIDIGSHTCTHPRLIMTEPPDLIYEIEGSKNRIEAMIDHEVVSFCYPNGAKSDYNEKIKDIVKAAGYKNAVVAYFDSDITEDLFELKRFGVGGDMFQFRKTIYGVEFLKSAAMKMLAM